MTLANYPGETPVLDGTHLRVPPNVDAGLFLLADKSYVAIRGFELRDYSSANLAAVPAGVFLRGACNSIQISNCNIHGIRNLGGRLDRSGNAFGIAVYGSSTTPAAGIVIDGNEVHNCRTGSSETLTLNGNVTLSGGAILNFNLGAGSDPLNLTGGTQTFSVQGASTAIPVSSIESVLGATAS